MEGRVFFGTWRSLPRVAVRFACRRCGGVERGLSGGADDALFCGGCLLGCSKAQVGQCYRLTWWFVCLCACVNVCVYI